MELPDGETSFRILCKSVLESVGMKDFFLSFFAQCFYKSQYRLVLVDQLIADQVQSRCGDDINNCMLFQEYR